MLMSETENGNGNDFSCLYPGTVKNPQNTGRHYEMIDKCPSGSSTNEKNALHQEIFPEKCGDVTMLWNTMLPVYSPSTRKLYKNTVCSHCHGIKDGVVWDIKRGCIFENKARHRKVDMSEYLNIDPEQSDSGTCELTFSFPGHWKDIEHARCAVEEPVNTCSMSSFEVPTYISMTSAEVVEACESSFYSPVYILTASKNVFSNIFCSICNLDYENLKNIIGMCENPNSLPRQFGQFAYLIKGIDIQKKYIEKDIKFKIDVLACPDESYDIPVSIQNCMTSIFI